MALNIWLIHHGEPPPTENDYIPSRTTRLARELASRGHDTTYWMSTIWHNTKKLTATKNTEYEADGYRIRQLHAGVYKSNYSLKRYIHHRKLASVFAKAARNLDPPDLIIAGFPVHFLAREAVKYGKKNNVPVVVDLRDFWPEIFLSMLPRNLQFLGKYLFAYDYAVTRQTLKGATALTSMMETLLDWGLDNFAQRDRSDLDKVFYIGGDPFEKLPDDIIRGRLGSHIYEELGQKMVINYSGSFTALNHPTILIEAANILNARGLEQRASFLLAGDGPKYEQCVSLANGARNIHFTGWVDSKIIEAINSISHLGVIPSIENATFPNKAFSYLGAGMPTFYSGEGDLLEIINEWSVGSHFDINDPADLADKLEKFILMPDEEYGAFSSRAKKLFNGKLIAKNIYKEFADYAELVVEVFQRRHILE